MESNPFAPPRTSDLDGGAPVALAGMAVAEEALNELAASAPWVRWFMRLTGASIVLGFITTIVTVAQAKNGTDAARAILGTAVATPISAIFFFVLRRYAKHAGRLAGGERSAAEAVIEAQSSYFKVSGVMIIIMVGLGILAVAGGIVALLSRKMVAPI
jgi:hypothetical protein